MKYLYGLTIDGSVVYAGISKRPDGVVDYWKRRLAKGENKPLDNLLRQCLDSGQDIGVLVLGSHVDNKEALHMLRRYQDKWEEELTRGRRIHQTEDPSILRQRQEYTETVWPIH